MAYNRNSHTGVPRNLAYDSEDAPYYSTKDGELSFLRNPTIFSGENQTTLFLLAMAYARSKNLPPQDLKKREANILTSAMGGSGNWLILAGGLADADDLMVLKDESQIYKDAEKYANAGFKEIKELVKMHGRALSEVLEIELGKLAEEFIAEEEAEKASFEEE